MKKQIPDFSIVFPVMNQADHIERVIKSYQLELIKNNFSFELIAVINGSNDKSFEICKRLEKQFSKLSAYELSGAGYGLGILHGLKKAQGKYFCYLNCARIKGPDLITALKYFLIDSSVIVHGVRSSRQTYRRLGSLIYNTFARTVFGIRNRDINGNPNIFSRENYKKLNFQSTDSMIDLELLDKARRLEIAVVEIPIYDYSRYGGISTSNFKTIFRLMKESLNYWVKKRGYNPSLFRQFL